jgi:CubicO group peptidase (beta-lactamase class C family)
MNCLASASTSLPRCLNLSLLYLLFVAYSVAAPLSPGTVEAQSLQAFEGKLEQLRKKYGIPGMAGLVAQSNHIVWARGFGLANRETGAAATPDTVFHLASLTKPFAAVVLLQLVEAGQLDLDAPVSEFGITLPMTNGVVRVRHLLTHTSEGEPGKSYRYNGTRFGELDKVLHRTTGKTFAELARERILDPLQLTNTAPNPAQIEACRHAGRDAAAFARRLARGYNSEDLRPVEYKKHFVTAAGLVSTVGDLAKFSLAWDDNRLLRSETKHLAFSPATSTTGKALPYGLGWFVQQRKAAKVVWHYGWWVGNSSLILKVPEEQLTFVLLANSDGLSRKFDLGRDENVARSPFAREFLAQFVDRKRR